MSGPARRLPSRRWRTSRSCRTPKCRTCRRPNWRRCRCTAARRRLARCRRRRRNRPPPLAAAPRPGQAGAAAARGRRHGADEERPGDHHLRFQRRADLLDARRHQRAGGAERERHRHADLSRWQRAIRAGAALNHGRRRHRSGHAAPVVFRLAARTGGNRRRSGWPCRRRWRRSATWWAGCAARGPGYAAAFAAANRVRCAVNQEFAGVDAKLRPGDEVAFFPPVTGG